MHFYTLVVVPKRRLDNADTARLRAVDLLAPFDENLPGSAIEVDCEWCDGPDPECEECEGTGKTISRFNQNGQYDWYQFGGRWSGRLDGYDPYEDPDLTRTCRYCDEDGIRRDLAGREPFTCNACGGTKREKLWATEYPLRDGDVQVVRQLTEEQRPDALVLPNGSWVGGVSGGLTLEEVNERLEPYVGKYWMLVVDCHT